MNLKKKEPSFEVKTEVLHIISPLCRHHISAAIFKTLNLIEPHTAIFHSCLF